MHYRRRYSGAYREYTKVQVTICWDSVTNATYQVKFDRIGGHWTKVQGVIEVIKASIPFSQREYESATKTWHIGEKYFEFIRDLCTHVPDFEVNVVEKPSEVRATTFISKESDYERFKEIVQLSGAVIPNNFSRITAKRVYIQAIRLIHPDISPDTGLLASELNSIWSRLKDANYFKEE